MVLKKLAPVVEPDYTAQVVYCRHMHTIVVHTVHTLHIHVYSSAFLRATQLSLSYIYYKFLIHSFSVGFKTIPMDSTGVSHILEHTTLCGSRRYPVRDPFFKMLTRSLSNFMNAFTG